VEPAYIHRGMEFTNRELAILIWLGVVVATSFILPTVRQSAFSLVRAFFQPKLLAAFGLASLYVGGSVWLLSILGAWEWSNLKTTIWWAVTTAFVSMFDLNRIDEDRTYFAKTVRDTLSLSTVIVFIAEFYAFSLGAELLLLPVTAFLAGVKAVADQKPEYRAVGNLVSGLLLLMGVSYFGYSAYQTAAHIGEFATLGTLREFGVPILLTLLFLPWLYVMSVFMVYENVFLGLRFGIPDERLRRFAKRHAILRFGFNLELLKRWRRQVLNESTLDRNSVRRSTREVKEGRRREIAPPPVDISAGWSPYSAQIFLRDEGWTTNDYHRSFDSWWANSPMIEIGDDPFPDNIAFYIEGDAETVKQVRLKLNVNNPNGAKEAERRFYELCGALLAIAVTDNARDRLTPLIETSDEIDEIADGRRVRLDRDEFTGIRGGYSRRLIIDHDADSDFVPS
jgi:hypothetical protein